MSANSHTNIRRVHARTWNNHDFLRLMKRSVLCTKKFRQFQVVCLRVKLRRHAHNPPFRAIPRTLALIQAFRATLALWHIAAAQLLVAHNRNDLGHEVSLFVYSNTTYQSRFCQNILHNKKPPERFSDLRANVLTSSLPCRSVVASLLLENPRFSTLAKLTALLHGKLSFSDPFQQPASI